jgi:hypothetical protein
MLSPDKCSGFGGQKMFTMLPNSKMVAGRFLKRQKYINRYRFIIDNLNAGKTVYVCTTLKATAYTKKHIDFFKLYKNGVYVVSGKRELCIDLCSIKAV